MQKTTINFFLPTGDNSIHFYLTRLFYLPYSVFFLSYFLSIGNLIYNLVILLLDDYIGLVLVYMEVHFFRLLKGVVFSKKYTQGICLKRTRAFATRTDMFEIEGDIGDLIHYPSQKN
ncbi:hypothetical protein ACJX0J_019790 [Zea mays]